MCIAGMLHSGHLYLEDTFLGTKPEKVKHLLTTSM